MKLFFAMLAICALQCMPGHAQTPDSTSSDVPLPKRSTAEVLGSVPHNKGAFTEGLTFSNGKLYESTGMYGESYLHEVDISTGKELRRVTLDKKYFGEGLAILKGKLYQLTWKQKVCFVYDLATFRKTAEIKYEGEGWGLTTDGRSLIMSDGSEWIRYRDPATFKVTRSLQIRFQGQPVTNLNELEVIDGKIWANVWGSNYILRIEPSDGRILEIIDASNLLPANLRSSDPNDVLNGIAYNDKTKSIYLTGKRWPLMYKIRLSP